jgi:hypothetical protein
MATCRVSIVRLKALVFGIPAALVLLTVLCFGLARWLGQTSCWSIPVDEGTPRADGMPVASAAVPPMLESLRAEVPGLRVSLPGAVVHLCGTVLQKWYVESMLEDAGLLQPQP